MKLPIPLIAYPTAILWVVALIVATTNYHPGFLTYRQFTGGLFTVAVLATVYLIWRSIRAENKPRA